MIEGSGQPLHTVIEFEDGGWYREESKAMARRIGEGRLEAEDIAPTGRS